jgi:hypothetical protein
MREWYSMASAFRGESASDHTSDSEDPIGGEGPTEAAESQGSMTSQVSAATSYQSALESLATEMEGDEDE